METRTDARSRFETVLDVKYAIRYNMVCERFYRKANKLLTFVALFSSSAVFYSAVGDPCRDAGVAAVFVGVAALIGQIWGPGEKAVIAAQRRDEYAELLVREMDLDDVQLERALRIIHSRPSPDIEALRRPAYNQNLQQESLLTDTNRLPESWWNRLMSLVA